MTLKGKKSATMPKKTSGQAGSGKLTTENGSCSHDGAASSCDKIGACYTCEQFVAHPTALPPELLEKWSGGKPAKRPKTTIDAGSVYSADDLKTICTALEKAFAKGKITKHEALPIWLMMGLGLRPIQLSALTVGHFQVKKGCYYLQVPNARGESITRLLLSEIGRVLEPHIKNIVKEYRATVRKSERILESDQPIFPARKRNSDSYDFARPNTVAGIVASLKGLSARLALPPQLSLDPLRFRRTMATMAAKHAYSIAVIAEMMHPGHGSSEKAYQYVQASPGALKRVNVKMSALVKAFKGKIVPDADAGRKKRRSR